MANRPRNAMEIFRRGSTKTPVNTKNNSNDPRIISKAIQEEKNHFEEKFHMKEQECFELKNELQQTMQSLRSLQEKFSQLQTEHIDLMVKVSSLEDELLEIREEKELLESLSKTKRGRFYLLSQRFQKNFLNRPSKEELEQKKIFQNEACFDNYLENIEKDDYGKNVPKIIVECVKILESKPQFMSTQGLYRVSGNYSLVQKLRFKIDGKNYKYLREQKDPHTLTGLIKLFLRELKQPLITLQQLKAEINDDTFLKMDLPEQIKAIKNVIIPLPDVNKETLNFLMEHLNKVSANSYNQMNGHSLSIVIGACIFYEIMSDLNLSRNIEMCTVPNFCIQLMIENYFDVFY